MNTFRQKGWALIPGLFSVKEVDRLRAEALIDLTNSPQLEIRHGYPTLMYWPSLEVPERIFEIATQVLGNEYKQVNNQVYFHLPGDPDEFAWHTDSRFWPEAKDYLQTAIIIDPWNPDNCVEFLDQREWQESEELRKFERMGLKGTKVEANPGDVVIWTHKIVHGSERNKTRQGRMYYMNGFLK